MQPGKNPGFQFNFKSKSKEEFTGPMLTKKLQESNLQGSKTLLNQSVFEDSNALQQQEKFQVSSNLN